MYRISASLLVFVVTVGCDGLGQRASEIDQPTPRQAVFRGEFPIRALTTVGMVADLVRQVGGPQVKVHQLMGAGIDPHLYKPTRDDVLAITSADIVFYSGLMLEGKLAHVLDMVGRRKPVIAVTEALDSQQLLATQGGHANYDPHVWMDVSAWSQCVEVVANTLAQFDAAHADDYHARANSYRVELAALHAYGLKSIQSIPEARRLLITSHDAFNYFGRAYQLDVYGVQGISTESEAGLVRINGLVNLLVTRQIPAVFVESSVPRKSIEALIAGARSRGHRVVIGGELYSDAMGSEGTYEGTYVGMLDYNITRVTRALGGTAPAAGMHGKLSKRASSH